MEKLIDLFKLYLSTQAGLPVGQTAVRQVRQVSSTSVRNYVVDLRNFLEWYILHLKTNQTDFDEENPANLGSLVTREDIELYKNFLINNETPIKTINRRLSTLRKFGSMIVSQGWQNINPAKGITNAGSKQIDTTDPYAVLLKQFETDLESEKINPVTIKNYLVDTKQFLKFMEINS